MICDKCGYWLTAFTIKDCPGCKRVRILEEKLTVSELAVQFCDPIVDELNVSIRELKANEAAWMCKEAKISESNIQQAARIRELEEAMPDPKTLRAISNTFTSQYPQDGLKAIMCRMADRIEKVMTKQPEEKNE